MKRCLVLFLFFFTNLFADDTIDDITAKEGLSYNYWGEFVNMLLTLAFVIVLIFATVWILKKLMRSRVKTLNRTNGIKILERRPLNPKASLYLVDILGKGVVISESPSGVQVITEFPEHVKIEELIDKMQEEQQIYANSESFVKRIKKLITHAR